MILNDVVPYDIIQLEGAKSRSHIDACTVVCLLFKWERNGHLNAMHYGYGLKHDSGCVALFNLIYRNNLLLWYRKSLQISSETYNGIYSTSHLLSCFEMWHMAYRCNSRTALCENLKRGENEMDTVDGKDFTRFGVKNSSSILKIDSERKFCSNAITGNTVLESCYHLIGFIVTCFVQSSILWSHT